MSDAAHEPHGLSTAPVKNPPFISGHSQQYVRTEHDLNRVWKSLRQALDPRVDRLDFLLGIGPGNHDAGRTRKSVERLPEPPGGDHRIQTGDIRGIKQHQIHITL